MRIITLSVLAVVMGVSFLLSAAAEKDGFTVTISPNAKLDASFHRKERTKQKGWKVFIKLTNKTDKPVLNISTSYQLREGGWIISENHTSWRKSEPLLMPHQTAVFGWIDGVPSSVDSIHIGKVELE